MSNAPWSFIIDRLNRGEHLRLIDVEYSLTNLNLTSSQMSSFFSAWCQSQSALATAHLKQLGLLTAQARNLQRAADELILAMEFSNAIQLALYELNRQGWKATIQELKRIEYDLSHPQEMVLKEDFERLARSKHRLARSLQSDRPANLRDAWNNFNKILDSIDGQQSFLAWFAFGQFIREEYGDHIQAFELFRNARRLHADSITVHRYYVDTLYKLGRFREAYDEQRAFYGQRISEDSEAWFDLCRYASKSGLHDVAEREFEALIASYPIYADLALMEPDLNSGHFPLESIIDYRFEWMKAQTEEYQSVIARMIATIRTVLASNNSKPTEEPRIDLNTISYSLMVKNRDSCLDFIFKMKCDLIRQLDLAMPHRLAPAEHDNGLRFTRTVFWANTKDSFKIFLIGTCAFLFGLFQKLDLSDIALFGVLLVPPLGMTLIFSWFFRQYKVFSHKQARAENSRRARIAQLQAIKKSIIEMANLQKVNPEIGLWKSSRQTPLQ